LHLQGLQNALGKLRIGLEVLPDLLDDLARLVDVGVVGDTDGELLDRSLGETASSGTGHSSPCLSVCWAPSKT
jgi:hypothetical protein